MFYTYLYYFVVTRGGFYFHLYTSPQSQILYCVTPIIVTIFIKILQGKIGAISTSYSLHYQTRCYNQKVQKMSNTCEDLEGVYQDLSSKFLDKIQIFTYRSVTFHQFPTREKPHRSVRKYLDFIQKLYEIQSMVNKQTNTQTHTPTNINGCLFPNLETYYSNRR